MFFRSFAQFRACSHRTNFPGTFFQLLSLYQACLKEPSHDPRHFYGIEEPFQELEAFPEHKRFQVFQKRFNHRNLYTD